MSSPVRLRPRSFLASSLLLAGLLFSGSAPTACPQADSQDLTSGVIDRIVRESLVDGQAYRMLRSLCETAPHRLSGSSGAARAVRWASEQMTEMGFDNVRLEPCVVPFWERGSVEELVITAPPELMGQRLSILALGGSIGTPEEGIEASVVAVSSFEELAALGEAARGRIVLFNRPMEDGLENTFKAYSGAVEQRVSGAVIAARAGAVAAIVRSMTTLRDDVPHTGGMRYEEGVARIPSAAVSTFGADRVAALLAAGQEVRVRLVLDCRENEPVESFNVVGEIVGHAKPEEIVLVGGHLDSWDVGQGAHDDGAGCVQAMEALRLVKALGLRPQRTLRCVLFMNEENGLAGGRAYYSSHLSEMSRHVVAIESDRGGFTPRGFVADATPAGMAALRAYAARVASTGIDGVSEGGGGADISPMAASGVPLVGLVPDPQRYFDLHHSESDVFSAINKRELHLGAAAIAGLVWQCSEALAPLPRTDSVGQGSR